MVVMNELQQGYGVFVTRSQCLCNTDYLPHYAAFEESCLAFSFSFENSSSVE